MNRLLALFVVGLSTLAAADSGYVINFVNPGDPPQNAACILSVWLSITELPSWPPTSPGDRLQRFRRPRLTNRFGHFSSG